MTSEQLIGAFKYFGDRNLEDKLKFYNKFDK